MMQDILDPAKKVVSWFIVRDVCECGLVTG